MNIWEVLIDLENIETSETNTLVDFEEPSLPECNLTLRDKKIITKNEWLSNKYMEPEFYGDLVYKFKKL